MMLSYSIVYANCKFIKLTLHLFSVQYTLHKLLDKKNLFSFHTQLSHVTNHTGLHEQLSLLVLKLGVSPNTGEGTVLAAIRCLSALLNYVMSVVKKALQVTPFCSLFCFFV